MREVRDVILKIEHITILMIKLIKFDKTLSETYKK